jgi:purine-binding chemotaxis protein CheW
LIVDTAREFVSIPASLIQPPHEAIRGLSGKYLEGIAALGERLVLIMSIDEALRFADSPSEPELKGVMDAEPPARLLTA